ncbi:MAG: nuclear transport factor 2 family protein [Solirubrobacteraceae bacterium]|jgi:ketosteroid isomerase-like protein
MASVRAEGVRRGIERLRETGELELGEVTDDFVWDLSTYEGWPEQPEYRGAEGADEFIRDWLDAWSEWSIEVERILECGVRVVALCRQRGTAKASGAPVETAVAQVWTFQGERAARMRMYATHQEALAAVGATEAAR